MLIFGTYVLHKVLATLGFFCPHCQGAVEGQVRRGRRWFHIFWIPLIPLGVQPEHVRCFRCGSLWALAVLGPDGDQYRRVPAVAPLAPAGGDMPPLGPGHGADVGAPGPVPPPPPPAPSGDRWAPPVTLPAAPVDAVPVEDSEEWARRNGLTR
ncbi:MULTISPECIES: hypothetical protein [unclassified Actinotalea]|uniref:hypothetical protein n=1 Tax=unclassified Actinotalea TaxID=2638618 RepID=UPI0015F543C1|nr:MULTISPECIES: hypothetical protein [unclassified Actinotalea]